MHCHIQAVFFPVSFFFFTLCTSLVVFRNNSVFPIFCDDALVLSCFLYFFYLFFQLFCVRFVASVCDQLLFLK